MAERVLITFEVDATGAIKQVDNVKKKINEVPGAATKADAGVKGLMSTMAKIGGVAVVAGAALKGLRSSIRFIGDSIEASAAQERVFAQLNSAIERVGGSIQKATPFLNDFFAKIQATTRFGDDESATAFQRLATNTGSLTAAYKLLIPIMDMSIASGAELNNTVKLISMAYAGQFGTLSRYNIQLSDTQKETILTGTEAEKTAVLVDLLNQKFGGAAVADMETYGGQLQGMSNSWGDFKEAVGDVFTSMIQNSEALITITEIIQVMTESVNGLELALRTMSNWYTASKNASAELFDQNAAKALEHYNQLLKEGTITQQEWSQIAGPLIAKMGESAQAQNDYSEATAANNARILELTKRLIGVKEELADVDEALGQTGKSTNENANASKKAVKAWENVITTGVRMVDEVNRGNRGFSLFENVTATLGETIGFELNPATSKFLAGLIEMRRAAAEAQVPLKKMEETIDKTAETMEKSFSDLLTKGLAGELDSFGDFWNTIWGNLATDAVGKIGDAFSEALEDGGTVSGVVARFTDNFWTSLSEGSTGEQVGTLVSGVGGVINAAQGQGGLMGGIQGAMSGATSAMALGAMAGSATFPVVGTIIGAVIGGVIGYFGSKSKEQKPSSQGFINFSNGRDRIDTRNQGLSYAQEQAWINERRVQFQAQAESFKSILRIFNDPELFDLINNTGVRFQFDGNQTLDDLTSLFTESALPSLMNSMFQDALVQGFANMGVSQGAFDQMWGEIGIMDAGEQVEALRNYVTALVGTAAMIKNMDWESILQEVDSNSMEAFANGFNMMLSQIQQSMLGLDDMSFQERANMANTVNDMILTARQAEIQMLQQINSIQDSINASVDSMLEDIMLGGMEPAGQSSYFLDNITRLMDDLASGTGSPDELANLMSELMRYISEYRNVMGENFYLAGEDGVIPAEWITQILETARTMSNDQSEGFRNDIQEMNQLILDELILIYEALTLTTEERLGIDVAVTVSIEPSPDFIANVRTQVEERIWTRLEDGHWVGGNP